MNKNKQFFSLSIINHQSYRKYLWLDAFGKGGGWSKSCTSFGYEPGCFLCPSSDARAWEVQFTLDFIQTTKPCWKCLPVTNTPIKTWRKSSEWIAKHISLEILLYSTGGKKHSFLNENGIHWISNTGNGYWQMLENQCRRTAAHLLGLQGCVCYKWEILHWKRRNKIC